MFWIFLATKMRTAMFLVRDILCVGGVIFTALFGSHAMAQVDVEIRLADDTVLGPNSPAPAGRKPVLFVHGHKPGLSPEPGPNYIVNWQDPRDGTSFKNTLEHADNSQLDIEAYYINFADQDRSILDDANAISFAVTRILKRHDPNFDQTGTTAVRVAIIAYSKGTLSARLYLKSLDEPLADLPADFPAAVSDDNVLVPPPAFNPVSEFVAISPPNHGIRPLPFVTPNSISASQLYNGRTRVLCDPFSISGPWITGFFTHLNGYPLNNAVNADAAMKIKEAPGSRPDGAPPHTGVLYLALYAAGNADFIGGDAPETAGDCDDRPHARNLAPDAVNIEVTGIQGGTSVEVHQNTVHHSDVICAALHTVIHQRAPAGPLDTLCAQNGGVPVIPLPERASVGLVLDFSGSMILPACPGAGCARRHQVLKDAAEIFMTLWSLLGSDRDRTSITLFRGSATVLDDNGQTLLPLPATGDVSQITGLFANETPSGSTAMGRGIDSAIASLAAVQGVRRLLLVTDGLQNVQPLVEEQASGYAIASASPLDLSDTGIPIDTIAIGDGAHAELLSAIAADTGGQAFATNVPDEQLRAFFIEQLIAALKGFSPQLIAYRHGAVGSGGQSAEAYAINSTLKKLAFKLSWKRGRDLDLRIERNGKDVTALGRMVKGPFYNIWVADTGRGNVAPHGTWRMLIEGDPATPYEAAALADEHELDLQLALQAGTGTVGEPLQITFQMLRGGKPVVDDLDVDVTIRVPRVGTGTLIAIGNIRLPKPTDPRASPGERRLNALLVDPKMAAVLRPGTVRGRLEHAGKGVYRASFTGTEVPGTYSVTVEATGPDDAGGQVQRQISHAVNVRFSGGVAARSDLKRQSDRSEDSRRQVTLSIRPQDKFGNFLGPDRSGAIAVTSDNTKSLNVRRIADHGDGRYGLELVMAADAEPRISISVAGAELYSGWLDKIAR